MSPCCLALPPVSACAAAWWACSDEAAAVPAAHPCGCAKIPGVHLAAVLGAGCVAPRAPECYRFVLQHPVVAVALAATKTRAELDEDLGVLGAAGPLGDEEYAALAAHGERVRRHAGAFI